MLTMNGFVEDELSPESKVSDTITIATTTTSTTASNAIIETTTTTKTYNDDDINEPLLFTTINEALELQLKEIPSLVHDDISIDTHTHTPITVTTVNDSIDNNNYTIEPITTPNSVYNDDNYNNNYIYNNDDEYNNENWIDPYPIDISTIDNNNDTNENRYNDLVSFTNEDLMSVLRSLQDNDTDNGTTDGTTDNNNNNNNNNNSNDENNIVNIDIDWIKPILHNSNNNDNNCNNNTDTIFTNNNNIYQTNDNRNFENVFVDGNTLLTNNHTIISNHYTNQQYNNLNNIFDTTTIPEFASEDDYYPTINNNIMLDDNDSGNVYTNDNNEPFSQMIENTTFGKFFTLDGININSVNIDDDNMFLPPLDVSNLEYINNDIDNDVDDYYNSSNKYDDDIMEGIIKGDDDNNIDNDDTNMFDLGNIDTIFDDFDDAAINTNTSNNNSSSNEHTVDNNNNNSNDVMNLIDQIQTMGINDSNTHHQTDNNSSSIDNNYNITSNIDDDKNNYENNDIDYNDDDYITKNLLLDNEQLLESYFDYNDVNDFDFFQTLTQSIMTPPYEYCQPCTTTLTTTTTTPTTETMKDDVLDKQTQRLPKTLTDDEEKLCSSTVDTIDDKTKPDNNSNMDTLIQNFASTGLDDNNKNKINKNKEIAIDNTNNDNNNEPAQEETELDEEVVNDDEHDDADQSTEKTANRPLSEMIHKKSITSTKTKKQQRQSQQQQKKASLTLKQQQQQQSSQKSKIVSKQQHATVQDDNESKYISLSDNATDQSTKNAYLDTNELYCLPCSTTFNEVTEQIPSRAEPAILSRSIEDVISILEASANVVASFNVQYNEKYLHTISSDYNVSYDTIDTVIDTLATLQNEQQQQVQQVDTIPTSISTGNDETDVSTTRNRKTCVGHQERILGCDLSECGRYLATASQDSTIMIWDASTGICLSKLLFNDEYEMLRVKWASTKWGQNKLRRPHSSNNNNSNNKDTDDDNDTTNFCFTYMLAAGGADGNVHLYGTDNPINDNWQKYCTLNHASFSHYDTNLAQDAKDKPQIYSLQFIDRWKTMFTSTSTSTDNNNNAHPEEKNDFPMPTNVQNSFLLTTSDDHIHLWEVKNSIDTINKSNTIQESTTEMINLSEVYSIRFSSWEDDYTYGVTVCHVTDSSIFGPRGIHGGDEEKNEIQGNHNSTNNKPTLGGDRNPNNLVYVFYAEYCTSNNLLAAALSDGTIRLMNWRGVCLSVFQLPGVTKNQRYGLSHLTSFDWDSTGQRLATCVANGSVVTWHVHNLLSQDGIGERLKNTCCSILTGGHEYGKPLFGVQYINVIPTTSIGNNDENRIGSSSSKEDQLMISWGFDGEMCLWDSYSEDKITSPIATLFHQPRYPIYALSSKKVQSKTDNTKHTIRIAVAGGEPPEYCSDGVSVYVYDIQLSPTKPKMAP